MSAKRSLLVAIWVGSALVTAPAVAADNPFHGTWVLNTAKSQGHPSAPVPNAATIVLSDAGGGKTKAVSDMVSSGVNLHGEITYSLDGKEYTPTTNLPTPAGAPAVAQTYERVGDRSYKMTLKMSGQPIATILTELSGDGKTLTETMTAAGGASSKFVYDRK